jgi:LSD1 subclass zinc finger protein
MKSMILNLWKSPKKLTKGPVDVMDLSCPNCQTPLSYLQGTKIVYCDHCRMHHNNIVLSL